jgi:hypothetical protein
VSLLATSKTAPTTLIIPAPHTTTTTTYGHTCVAIVRQIQLHHTKVNAANNRQFTARSIDQLVSASVAMAQKMLIELQKKDAFPSGEDGNTDTESADAEIDTTTPAC